VTLAAGFLSEARGDPPAGGDKAIADKLAVQTAMLQGRDYLRQGEPAKAIAVLEAQLARIDGSRPYLMTLRDAYQAYITDLCLHKQNQEARKYLERLRILDPAAAAALEARPTAPAGRVVPAAQVAAGAPAPTAPAYVSPLRQNGPARPPSKVRMLMGEEPRAKGDPFAKENELPRLEAGPGGPQARDLLARARAEFARGRYGEAGQLFDQARRAGPELPAESANQLAYCKLSHVFTELQKSGDVPCEDLDREVQDALRLSTVAKLTAFGRSLQDQLARRRPGPGGAAEAVRHYTDERSGLLVAESAHFRVFHRQSRDLAERVAKVAEQTRLAMSRKWLGNDGEEWVPKCDVFLHATRDDYLGAGPVALDSPGHSRIETDPATGRVVSRRMHLRCDNPALLGAVLPHETTHVVIAGLFGGRPAPRWIDEGIAVLSEPAEKVNQHRQNLARAGRDHDLFPVRELVQMDQYPAARRITTFYAQSVSLVEFLSRQKGPLAFSRFVRDCQREGCEAALRRHYGYRDLADLEARWNQEVVAGLAGPGPALAER
jgi:tetratricopeptide (TPR) repeat protein